VSDPASSPEVGRRYVLAVALLLALTEIAITAAYVVRIGTDRLPQRVVRFLLLLGLAYALLRRHQWARWVTVILLLLGAWALTGPLLASGAFSGDQLWGSLALLALFVGYGVIVRGLLFSTSVRAFFASRAIEPGTPPS
jgi:hypothetical protein